MGLTPGTRFGHYEVTAIVGAGGMGEVYRARDTRLKRDVALKVLPESFAGDPDRLARLAREAEMLAALNHPHIATIHGLEEADGTRALVMELVDGETLGDRIARGPIPVDEALPIARQIAEALEAAHEQGIVHRDLKPANVRITAGGRVKVLDFGLARAADGTVAQGAGATLSPTITSPAMTQAGIILGTAAYMSPEQAKGQSADRRADIWAFGVVLFEMLSGQRPFAGDDVSDVLASVLARDPQFALLPDTVPASLRALIRACLQKDPRQRLHHAADVRLALEGAFDSGRGAAVLDTVPPARLTTRGAAAALMASISIAAAAGAAAAWALKPAAATDPTAFVHPLGTATFTRAGRPVLALSPDARRLAYVADYQLYVRERNDPVARPILGTREGQGPSSPAFSPAGDSIAYWSEQAIKRIPVSGGTPMTLAEAALPLGLSWGADGTIVYAQGDGIWRMRDNGAGREHIVRAAAGERMHAPQILPSGDAVLFAVTTEASAEAWDRASIVVQELRTGRRRVVHRGAYPRYVRTGHLLYVTGSTLFAATFDPAAPEEVGDPVQIATGVQRSIGPPIGIAQYATSDNGGLAYVGGLAGSGVDLVVVEPSATRALPATAGENLFPRLSPDDTRIAVQRGRGDDANIWIYDIARTQWVPLTLEGGQRPLWNRAGDSITFLRGDELWQIPADGGAEQRLDGTKVPGNQGPYDWSPRDELLLYGSRAGIHAYRPDRDRAAPDRPDAPEVVVSPGGAVDAVLAARFSPDGKAIAYLTIERMSDPYVYVAPFPLVPGAQRKVSVDAAVAPVWSRAGGTSSELYLARNNALHAIKVTETSPVLRWLNRVEVLPPSLSRILSDGGIANYDVFKSGAFVTLAPTADRDGNRAGQQIDVLLHWFDDPRMAAR